MRNECDNGYAKKAFMKPVDTTDTASMILLGGQPALGIT